MAEAENCSPAVSLALAPGSFHFTDGRVRGGQDTLLKLCYGELTAPRVRCACFDQECPAAMARDGIANGAPRIGVVHMDCQFLDISACREPSPCR